MIEFLRKVIEPIKTWWSIQPLKGEDYSYIVTDVEAIKQNSLLKTVVYFRALGSRSIEHAGVEEFNNSNKLRYFKTEHAQLIVTLATLESILSADNENIINLYKDYLKICKQKLSK